MGLAAPRYRRGETSMESSIPCSHRGKALVVKGGQGGEECKGKLQVPRQGERAEAKEFHKIGVDGLLIKIAESGDFGLMQECSTKERSREYVVLYLSTQRKGSARTNKDQHNSANPTLDSVIGELKQHDGSEFDYLTTTTKRGWESKRRVATKVED
ncbi:hypothetical protein GW17_00037352 [Ensete ventricosum]|nr:hypothetical protein GW17_00037352 [Ensete ventricosum]